MRVAAIYDIHGNLPALEAVLADIDRIGVDIILVGGDLAAGPMPCETLDLLMSLGNRVRLIRGNADRELVAHYDLPGEQPIRESDPELARAAWAAQQLTRVQRDFLAGLAERAVIDVDDLGPVLFCHGSPRSDEEIITRVTPEARMREMLAGAREGIIVCGHTHVQFDRVVADTRMVNAGSVGMPYEGSPGAYWALLGPTVALRRTTYDVEHAASLIRSTGFPNADAFADTVLKPPTAEEATAFFEQVAAERIPEVRV
ncbi:MAG TPA: metallophosphoesterase family protein [Thermomicrobiales bacterium]|nr:metallophosphoesterase family protein [Thermomicrobiales bacterium]